MKEGRELAQQESLIRNLVKTGGESAVRSQDAVVRQPIYEFLYGMVKLTKELAFLTCKPVRLGQLRGTHSILGMSYSTGTGELRHSFTRLPIPLLISDDFPHSRTRVP